MFSLLHRYKFLFASLILCVFSSIIVQLSIFWIVKVKDSSPLVSPNRDILILLCISIATGLVKSLMVSIAGYLIKSSLRWIAILGSVLALTTVEGWFWYILWNIGPPNFG
jgi:chromate transport protein ChrA